MSVADIKYSFGMGRWEPGADTRLREAAFELFARDGFANVTVEQIAEAAGVTERTFFRHFPTKEEVFFSDPQLIISELIEAIRGCPTTSNPAELVEAAVTRLAQSMEPNRKSLRLRAQIIASNESLRERELLKQHAVAMSLVGELVGRGLPPNRAAALAGTAMMVFQVAYTTWTNDKSRITLASRLSLALADLAIDLER
jgi:AcrR family transcriptional regulator